MGKARLRGLVASFTARLFPVLCAALVSLSSPTIASTEDTGTLTPPTSENNLLENSSFESWPAGTSSNPDGWILNAVGGTIAREGTVIKLDTHSAKVGNKADHMAELNYIVPWKNDYRDRTFTLGCWVYCDTASRVRIKISDGVSNDVSDYHSDGSSWEFLAVEKTLDDSATKLEIDLRIESGTPIFAYFDGVTLLDYITYFNTMPQK